MNKIIALSTAALIGLGTIGVAHAQGVTIQSPVGVTLQPPIVATPTYQGYHDPDPDVVVVRKHRHEYREPGNVTVVRHVHHDQVRNRDYDDRGVVVKKY